MSINVYVEGGGDNKPLRTACREGFSKFIRKAGFAGNMPRIVACGSREKAYDKFKTAVRNKQAALLLVDAEGPVTDSGPWAHLKDREKWDRPVSVNDDQCHLMVQVMESWFLADRDALKSFYGKGFRMEVLPKNQTIEQVSKRDIENRLEQATRDTQKGGYYKNKGKHSFAILAGLNPAKVSCNSPYAARFLNELERISGQ